MSIRVMLTARDLGGLAMSTAHRCRRMIVKTGFGALAATAVMAAVATAWSWRAAWCAHASLQVQSQASDWLVNHPGTPKGFILLHRLLT